MFSIFFRYSHQEVYAKFSLQTADGRQQQSTTTTMGTVLFDLKLLETLDIPGTALDVWRDVLPEDVASSCHFSLPLVVALDIEFKAREGDGRNSGMSFRCQSPEEK